jgi:hypothetical protein
MKRETANSFIFYSTRWIRNKEERTPQSCSTIVERLSMDTHAPVIDSINGFLSLIRVCQLTIVQVLLLTVSNVIQYGPSQVLGNAYQAVYRMNIHVPRHLLRRVPCNMPRQHHPYIR